MFKEELNYFQSLMRSKLEPDKNLYCKTCGEVNPCRFMPSPDAGPYWRCSKCGEEITSPPIVVIEDYKFLTKNNKGEICWAFDFSQEVKYFIKRICAAFGISEEDLEIERAKVLNVDYTITLEKPLDFIHFDLTSTTDGECISSNGTFVESHSLPKIATECGNVLTTDGNGHFYWLPPYHEDMEVEKQEEKFCQRCNNKLEIIKSKISIFSDDEEEVFKCTNCGWC